MTDINLSRATINGVEFVPASLLEELKAKAEPNTETRHILARLDQETLEVYDIEKKLILLSTMTQNLSSDCADRLKELKKLRAELHPYLDPSAPRVFPYDSRSRLKED